MRRRKYTKKQLHGVLVTVYNPDYNSLPSSVPSVRPTGKGEGGVAVMERREWYRGGSCTQSLAAPRICGSFSARRLIGAVFRVPAVGSEIVGLVLVHMRTKGAGKAPRIQATTPHLKRVGSLEAAKSEEDRKLAVQVAAFFLAGILFCLMLQALSIYITIFSAYERPVFWAFLCSVPLRELKLNLDQVLKAAKDPQTGTNGSAGEDETSAKDSQETNQSPRLRVLLYAAIGYIVYGWVGRDNALAFCVVCAIVLLYWLCSWICLYSLVYLLLLVPPIKTCLDERLDIKAWIWLINPLTTLRLLATKCSSSAYAILKKIANTSWLVNSVPMVVIVLITLTIGLMSAYVSMIVVPLEFYGSMKSIQGKLSSYIPVVDHSLLMDPVVAFGVEGKPKYDHPGGTHRTIGKEFNKFLSGRADNFTITGNPAKETIRLLWMFPNVYLIDEVSLSFCDNVDRDSSLEIEGLGLYGDEGRYSFLEERWGPLVQRVKIHEGTSKLQVPRSLDGLRITLFPSALSGEGSAHVCINNVTLGGRMDLQGTVRNILNDSAEAYPIITRIDAARSIFFHDGENGVPSTSITNFGGDDEHCRDIVPSHAKEHPLHEGDMKVCKDERSLIRKTCDLARIDCRSFIANVSIATGNTCLSTMSKCAASVFHATTNFSATNESMSRLETQMKTVAKEGLGRILSILGTVFGTVVMGFNWFIDATIFFNVLMALVYADKDPLSWVMTSYTSFNKGIQSQLLQLTTTYISGVFLVLARIVVVNGMLTWLTLDALGLAFSVTLGLLSAGLSLFGDGLAAIIMLVGGLVDLWLRDQEPAYSGFRITALLLIFLWRVYSPESPEAMQRHLVTQRLDSIADGKTATANDDTRDKTMMEKQITEDNTSILILVPWSIFGGVVAFGIGGVVIGPIVAVFPFLAKQMFRIYRLYYSKPPEGQQEMIQEMEDILKSPEKKYSRTRRGSLLPDSKRVLSEGGELPSRRGGDDEMKPLILRSFSSY